MKKVASDVNHVPSLENIYKDAKAIYDAHQKREKAKAKTKGKKR